MACDPARSTLSALIERNPLNIDFINPAQQPATARNLHHLELFYYVAKAGGITAALRIIPYGIQQPAVSSQLVRLEETLGAKLFQRQPFSLTPAGQEIYDQIAPFFSSLSKMANKARNDSQQHLRIAASATVLRQHLPEILRRLADETPGLRLTLRDSDQAGAERLLRDHEVDLAVTLLEAKPSSGLKSEVLLKLSMALVVPAMSPYQTAADVLKAHEDEPLPLISLPPREKLPSVFQQALSERELIWPTRLETSGLELVTAYVAAGFGVGLSVELAQRPIPPEVRELPLKGFPQLVYGALWAGRLPPIACRFLELARERKAELLRIGTNAAQSQKRPAAGTVKFAKSR